MSTLFIRHHRHVPAFLLLLHIYILHSTERFHLPVQCVETL